MELLISEKPLEGFHIVVDAGNGAGGFFAVSFLCNLILPFVFTHSQLYESFWHMILAFSFDFVKTLAAYIIFINIVY